MIRTTRSRPETRVVAAPDRRPVRVIAALAALAALAAGLLLLALVPKALAAPPAAGEVKTIQEISIEGEVRLPRVLFITARQAERPLDFLDHYAVDPAAVLGPLPAPGPLPALSDAGAVPADPATASASVPASAAVPISPQVTPTAGPAEEVRP